MLSLEEHLSTKSHHFQETVFQALRFQEVDIRLEFVLLAVFAVVDDKFIFGFLDSSFIRLNSSKIRSLDSVRSRNSSTSEIRVRERI